MLWFFGAGDFIMTKFVWAKVVSAAAFISSSMLTSGCITQAGSPEVTNSINSQRAARVSGGQRDRSNETRRSDY